MYEILPSTDARYSGGYHASDNFCANECLHTLEVDTSRGSRREHEFVDFRVSCAVSLTFRLNVPATSFVLALMRSCRSFRRKSLMAWDRTRCRFNAIVLGALSPKFSPYVTCMNSKVCMSRWLQFRASEDLRVVRYPIKGEVTDHPGRFRRGGHVRLSKSLAGRPLSQRVRNARPLWYDLLTVNLISQLS